MDLTVMAETLDALGYITRIFLTKTEAAELFECGNPWADCGVWWFHDIGGTPTVGAAEYT